MLFCHHLELSIFMRVYLYPLCLELFTFSIAGQELKLICQVRGIPYPEITWYKDDEPVDTWVQNKDMYISQVRDSAVARKGGL